MSILGITVLQGEAAMVVVGVALGVTLISSLLHRKFVDRKKMDEVRAKVETHQKEYLAAQEAKDAKRLARLEAEQKEIMDALKDNMMASMKPTLITMPVVLILIWQLGAWYGGIGPLIDLPFGVPLLTKAVAEIGVANGVDWFGIYLVVAIGAALFLEYGLRKILKV
jgi:uncharacterized membrane protein (DUF106 family)